MGKRSVAASCFLSLFVCTAVGTAQDQSPVPAPPAVVSCDAQAVLADLDGRAPVPLLPRMAHHQKQNMRDHLVAVQEIVTALAAEDFAAVERIVGRIGYSQPMAVMCTHMGAGAPGFTDQAMNFHRTADTIADEAKRRDGKAVAAALGATLQTCTACHATFRQEVVGEESWARKTSLPPGAAPGMAWRHRAGNPR